MPKVFNSMAPPQQIQAVLDVSERFDLKAFDFLQALLLTNIFELRHAVTITKQQTANKIAKLHVIKIADDVALRLGLFEITEITNDIRRQPLYRELGL